MHHLTIVPQCLLREFFRSHTYQKLQSNRHHRRIIRVRFQIHTIATGILSLPELPYGFRRIVQPPTIRQQRDQFDSTETFHRVRVGRRDFACQLTKEK